MLLDTNKLGGQLTDSTTTVPVHATPAHVAGQDPEFLDAAGLQSRFGIKRSLAYSLLADDSIKGVSLRRRGRLRGKRLFDVASVRAFLCSQMESCGNENRTAPVHRESLKESR
jgi:hypothetical protein